MKEPHKISRSYPFFPNRGADPGLADPKWLGQGLPLCSRFGIWTQASGPRALVGLTALLCFILHGLSYSGSSINATSLPLSWASRTVSLWFSFLCFSCSKYLWNTFWVPGFHSLICSTRIYWALARSTLCQALCWYSGDLYWREIRITTRGWCGFFFIKPHLLLCHKGNELGEPPAILLYGAVWYGVPMENWRSSIPIKGSWSTLHRQHRVSRRGGLSQGRRHTPFTFLVNCFHWGLRTKSCMVPLSLLIGKLLICKSFNSHRSPGSLTPTSL